jgi:hypothetical protein
MPLSEIGEWIAALPEFILTHSELEAQIHHFGWVDNAMLKQIVLTWKWN